MVTTDGRDDIHASLYGVPSGGTAGAALYQHIGLSTNSTDPTAASTSLTDEINSGGITRSQATTIAHTDNSNRTDLSYEFSSSGTHTAIHSAGLFSAASGGILVHAAAFDNDVTLQANDTLTVEWQITLG